MNKTFYYVYFLVNIWNKQFKEKYFKLRYYLFILCHLKVWYWNKLKNAVNVCNYELIWLITWVFLKYYWLAEWRNCILSNIYNVIPIQSVRFVPTNGSAWALKIPPSQKSVTCVLDHTIIKPNNWDKNRKIYILIVYK